MHRMRTDSCPCKGAAVNVMTRLACVCAYVQDGGSDNVSALTHVFHWLLVYLGVFDEILWFRFEAG